MRVYLNMAETKQRQSIFELLRVLAIASIVILHYVNPLYGAGLSFVENKSLNFYILYYLKSICICGVNLFVLISGYFLAQSYKRTLWKPIELIVQVILFNIADYLVSVALGNAVFSVKSFLGTFIPANYFVILYCTVYLISPFINVLLDNLTHKGTSSIMALILMLLAIYPTIVDLLQNISGREFMGLSTIGMYGSQYGYSLVNFILMYTIGAYLRRKPDFLSKVKTGCLLCLYFGIGLLIFIWMRIEDYTGFIGRASTEYCNPLIITEAVILFLIFSRNNIGSIEIINRVAGATFTVFLFHFRFFKYLRIQYFVNSWLLMPHILCSITLIYLGSFMVHVIYHWIMDPVIMHMGEIIKLPIIDAKE